MNRRSLLSAGVPVVTTAITGCVGDGDTEDDDRAVEVVENIAQKSTLEPGVYEHTFSIEENQGININFVRKRGQGNGEASIPGGYHRVPGGYIIYEVGNGLNTITKKVTDFDNKEKTIPPGDYKVVIVLFEASSIPEYLPEDVPSTGWKILYPELAEVEYNIERVEFSNDIPDMYSRSTNLWRLHDEYSPSDYTEIKEELSGSLDDLRNILNSIGEGSFPSEYTFMSDSMPQLLRDSVISGPVNARLSIELIDEISEWDSNEKEEIRSIYRAAVLESRAVLAYEHAKMWIMNNTESVNEAASSVIAGIIGAKLGVDPGLIEDPVREYLDDINNPQNHLGTPEITTDETLNVPAELSGSIKYGGGLWSDEKTVNFGLSIEIEVSCPYQDPILPPHNSKVVGASEIKGDVSVHS